MCVIGKTRTDELILFRMGERPYEAAAEAKSCFWLEEGTHNGQTYLQRPEILGAMEKFLEDVAPKSPLM